MQSKFDEIYSTDFGRLLLDTLTLFILISDNNDNNHYLNKELSKQLSICGNIFTKIIINHYNLNEQEAKQIIADLAEYFSKKKLL